MEDRRQAFPASSYKSASDALAAVAHLSDDDLPLLRYLLVLSEASPVQSLIEARVPGVTREAVEVSADQEAATLVLSRPCVRGSEVARGTLLAVQLPASSCALFVSCGDGLFWRRVVRELVPRARPFLALGALHTDDLRGLLQGFAGALEPTAELRVTGMTRSCPLPRDDGPSRRMETERGWTDRSLSSAFEKLEEENAILRTAKFRVGPEHRPVAQGYVSRHAEFGVRGQQAVFYRSVVQPAADISARRFAQLRGRARVRETGFQPKPFMLEYPWPVFQQTPAVRKLASVLETAPHFTYSATHENPFLRASVLDELDGSCCEVIVASDSRVHFVPQTRSTAESLSRLCAHIFDRFAEGAIRELT